MLIIWEKMTQPKEHPQPSPEGFDFTENEKLFSRVSDARFRGLAFAPQTTIHKISLSNNNYGEFVFVTVSRPKTRGIEAICFWGQGYHEPRDRWLADEWFHHPANQFPATMKQKISRTEVEEILRERQAEIAPYAEQHRQSRRGQLFEDLAELADDDAISAELENLGGLFGALFDDLE